MNTLNKTEFFARPRVIRQKMGFALKISRLRKTTRNNINWSGQVILLPTFVGCTNAIFGK